ncbi:CGA synthase-related protein [Streptomyces sp. NBC_01433]|uniref:CGA synthase-related protein n=1 Tax=Streptomyces sp. NBC_01433 TaxID=2903864 RepID=UPI00225390CC|nr:CGA synthase-related protein [Streptomyces sp. NBC_01433]MCX4680632.1 CGA synthase-related protein [Streptomyces sp. NBC_01433]
MTHRITAPQPPQHRLLVAASHDDADAQTLLSWICAHLDGFEMVPVGEQPPGPPARAALVCGDKDLAERLEKDGIPSVFVATSGTVPTGGWPASRICLLHRPRWLPAPAPEAGSGPDMSSDGSPATRPAARSALHDARADVVVTMAPPRAVRSRGDGAVLQLALPAGLDDENRNMDTAAAGMLRHALATLEGAAVPVRGLVLAGRPPGANLLATMVKLLPGVEPLTGVGAAADRLLTQASLLVSSPLLAAVAQAHTARIPLATLPPLGVAQQAVLRALGDVDVVVPALDPTAGAPHDARRIRDLIATPNLLAARLDDVLELAGDDRRGAQQVARQVRQLLLVPM